MWVFILRLSYLCHRSLLLMVLLLPFGTPTWFDRASKQERRTVDLILRLEVQKTIPIAQSVLFSHALRLALYTYLHNRLPTPAGHDDRFFFFKHYPPNCVRGTA
jgi:hypothetical protein